MGIRWVDLNFFGTKCTHYCIPGLLRVIFSVSADRRWVRICIYKFVLYELVHTKLYKKMNLHIEINVCVSAQLCFLPIYKQVLPIYKREFLHAHLWTGSSVCAPFVNGHQPFFGDGSWLNFLPLHSFLCLNAQLRGIFLGSNWMPIYKGTLCQIARL